MRKILLNPTIQDNIRSSKEEEDQGIFLTELFVNILGYTLKPKANFNLVAEYKNQPNSRKADGAILHNDIAIGVIELKGTKTKNLDLASVDKTSKYSMSIGETYIKMQAEYNNIMSLNPVMVHEDYTYTINGYNFNNQFNDIANQLALSNNLTRPRWYRFEF